MFRLIGTALSLAFLLYVVVLCTGGIVDVVRHGVQHASPPVLACSARRC